MLRCTINLYKNGVTAVAKKLNVSEARRQFSRLIGGVSKRRTSVTITQHGKEQAALIGMAEYRELVEKARAFDLTTKIARPFTLRGSLELCCSTEDLVSEMRKIRSSWGESAQRSSDELAHKLGRK